MHTLSELRDSSAIIFEAISGSKAYGLDSPTSDTDIRGVFVAPEALVYAGDVQNQISDEKNDIVFYEIGRFLELLGKANPTALELLYTDGESIRKMHPVFSSIPKQVFLSQQCRETFAGYAHAQIKRARGLNKKISNPLPEKRKALFDFCFIAEGQGAVPADLWLQDKGWNQEQCGLVHIAHMPHLHALFYDETNTLGFRGIVGREENTQDVLLSSIPKGMQPVAYLSYNKDGFTRHCREHAEYWAWVKKRNPTRFDQAAQHGRNYDAKNMMHTFRLLEMAKEIATEHTIRVRRTHRDELLRIRNGEFTYEALLERAETLLAEIAAAYDHSTLPESVSPDFAKNILVDIRRQFYKTS